MIIKMMILNAIKSAFGGFAGGGAVGGVGSIPLGQVFATGGYTGDGGKYQPAGIVHRGEYVITKEATARLGRGFLDRLNYGGSAGYAMGGMVGVAPASSSIGQANNINITVNVDQNGNTQRNTSGEDTGATAKAFAKMIEEKVVEVIIKQKRAGNLLA